MVESANEQEAFPPSQLKMCRLKSTSSLRTVMVQEERDEEEEEKDRRDTEEDRSGRAQYRDSFNTVPNPSSISAGNSWGGGH